MVQFFEPNVPVATGVGERLGRLDDSPWLRDWFESRSQAAARCAIGRERGPIRCDLLERPSRGLRTGFAGAGVPHVEPPTLPPRPRAVDLGPDLRALIEESEPAPVLPNDHDPLAAPTPTEPEAPQFTRERV